MLTGLGILVTGIIGFGLWKLGMRRKGLVIFALLALPAWWSGDKMLQAIVTISISKQVLANVRDEAFMAELFGLEQPLQYADATNFDGPSVQENSLVDYITVWRELPPKERPRKDFKAYVEVRQSDDAPEADSQWYLYPVRLCDRVVPSLEVERNVCPYDVSLMQPVDGITREQFESQDLDREFIETVSGYRHQIYYNLDLSFDGKVQRTYAHVSDSWRNPFDQGVRQIFQRKDPDLWTVQWSNSHSHVTGEISIGGL